MKKLHGQTIRARIRVYWREEAAASLMVMNAMAALDAVFGVNNMQSPSIEAKAEQFAVRERNRLVIALREGRAITALTSQSNRKGRNRK